MLVTEFPIVTLSRLEQYSNSKSSMRMTEFPIVIFVRFGYSLKKSKPFNSRTPSPIIIVSKPLQALNAPLPMLVTESGIVMLVRLLQHSNAHLPMLVTPFPIVTLVRPLQ